MVSGAKTEPLGLIASYTIKILQPNNEQKTYKYQLECIKAVWIDIYGPPTPSLRPENSYDDLNEMK